MIKLSSKHLFLTLGPILFVLVILFHPDMLLEDSAWRVVAIAVWMITWWITEAVPIPITALLPIVLFPMTGVFDVKAATAPYGSSIIFLFMGGFMLALAMERHNLHKRIALNLVKVTGTSGNGVILGFMIATATLSMWISNTATAVIMLPIALSVTVLLEKRSRSQNLDRFKLALLLSIAYSANIGGMGTIIGTPPNIVLVGYMESFYGRGIDFLDWLLVGVPVVLMLITITYLLLVKVLFPNHLGAINGANELLNRELEGLGKWANEQKLVALIFGLTACGWVFKKQINMMIGTPLLSDTITAMAGGIAMFCVPTDKEGSLLMQWSAMKELPWGILVLFGGGLCLAKGMETTGIVTLLADAVARYDGVALWVVIAMLTTIMLFMTEVMSNVALTTIMIPVVLGIANGMGIEPIYLAAPVTMAASCAFMMPISTPPNAVVFSSGYIRMRDMIRAGVLLNILSIIILVLVSVTLVKWVF